MANSITLSKEHGVNPTIPVCFFCGEPRNEVALLGKLKDDKEASMYSIIDYEPCESCKEKMSYGVTLIGVVDKQPEDNRPPVKASNLENDLYPTGSWCVITVDDFCEIFEVEDKESIPNAIYLDQELLNKFLEETEQEDESGMEE